MHMKWNNWLFTNYICHTEVKRTLNVQWNGAFLPVLYECQDLLKYISITPRILLHTAQCAPISDTHDFSKSLHIFLWNLTHSCSILSQKLLTKMNGLSQSQPFLHGWTTKIILHIMRNPHIWKVTSYKKLILGSATQLLLR